MIQESKEQSAKAEDVLRQYSREDLENVISLKFCAILLHSGIQYVTELVDRGLLKDDEAEHWVHHIIQELDQVTMCTDSLSDYPGYIDVAYIDDDKTEVSVEESEELKPPPV